MEIPALRHLSEIELKRVRKQGDLVSIYDVIRAVTGHSQVVIRNTWKRSTEEYPELANVCVPVKFHDTGRGSNQETPATDVEGINSIIMRMGGRAAKEFRATRKVCKKEAHRFGKR